MPVESDAERHDIDIFAKKGSPVVAVNDGRITGFGRNAEDGRWIRLRDVYGNTFTYSHLGSVARTYPAPRERTVTKQQVRRELDLPGADPKPKAPASKTTHKRKAAKKAPAAPAKTRVGAPIPPPPSPSSSPRTACSPTRARRRPAPPAARSSWPPTPTRPRPARR